jgi:nucleoside-diphosphate-sugar epimerase
MTVLVVGASGATGRLFVGQLLDRGVSVRIIVRPQRALPENFTNRENLTTICATILDLSDAEMAQHVKGCDAVASCLGHNMSLKGIYAHPRRLVTEATRRLCNAIKANKSEKPAKFVLMNTAGNSNRDLHEPISFGQRRVVGLVRLLLPPHVDNEKAADFLRVEIGQDHREIEWVVVRPDTLTDAEVVTEYDEHPSPTRSAIFNPGSTSRINVAHFMARLITEDATWNKWSGQMPVIYNKVPS